MAHIGEELRLVLARLGELSALVLDLAEQACILNGQHRLIGKGAQKLDGALRELPRCPAADHQRTNDLIGAQQWHDEHRSVSSTHDDVENQRRFY